MFNNAQKIDTSQKTDLFLILDFGSQVTKLIARRLRELGFYSEVAPYNTTLPEISKLKPKGVILSGGPNSVYDKGSPIREDIKKISEIAPVLGICYGMQLMTHTMGGVVEKSTHREYGLMPINWKKSLIAGLNQKQNVWMSHGDVVKQVAHGFEIIAESQGQSHGEGHGSSHPAAMLELAPKPRMMGLQFHPEVYHTQNGADILKYFCTNLCEAKANWNSQNMFDKIEETVRSQVEPEDHVLCALSGGVDSSVVATLLTKILGSERVHCVFVDTGLLRLNEFENVLAAYKQIGLNVHGVDYKDKFLNELKDVSDPEQKRKIIGRLFIEIFEEELKSLKYHSHNLNTDSKEVLQKNNQNLGDKIKWLAQGTLYPDVIESISSVGGSHTIKSHHNVGGLPDKMKLKLLEPVRDLFKDEVRILGESLGLSHQMVYRHPFPGPGLGIRIMGAIDQEKLNILKKADHVYISYLREKNLYDKIWQAFCVLLPVKTVGVQGDGRSYEYVLALRAVTSTDGMTADWYPFEFTDLREISNRITNQVHGVNRVVYDVTSKPPATIEWE